jgi:hypothetical protein
MPHTTKTWGVLVEGWEAVKPIGDVDVDVVVEASLVPA